MRISDWSSDVCSSDLDPRRNRRRLWPEPGGDRAGVARRPAGSPAQPARCLDLFARRLRRHRIRRASAVHPQLGARLLTDLLRGVAPVRHFPLRGINVLLTLKELRSEEQRSEFQYLMRISNA